jgi:hypothetical protein
MTVFEMRCGKVRIYISYNNQENLYEVVTYVEHKSRSFRIDPPIEIGENIDFEDISIIKQIAQKAINVNLTMDAYRVSLKSHSKSYIGILKAIEYTASGRYLMQFVSMVEK